MTAARIEDGWLVVDCPAAADPVPVEIGIGDDWQPAFRDYHDGQRVAKIRPPADVAPRSTVWLRVGGPDAPAVNHGRYPSR